MRRIIQTSSVRCQSCRLPPRWCICPAGLAPVDSPLAVEILVHPREWFRPSSTGQLIERVMPASHRRLWRRESPIEVASVRRGGRELWVLHPHGAPPPAGARPEDVQAVLLDGSWQETAGMAREVTAWGRHVALPLQGESRYWLRAQADGERFSTAEALIALLLQLGCVEAAAQLQLHLELHVYAGLRARGQRERATTFLQQSPVRDAVPELLAQLNTPRPREGGALKRES